MIHAVIMAGGKGTRFWPLSRAARAKQFLRIVGEKTLLEQTVERVLPSVDRIWLVGNQAHAPFFSEMRTSVAPHRILYEPEGRNTAPCIGWAAAEVLKDDPDGIMVVLPADHTITDEAHFQALINQAVAEVRTNSSLVTLGIKPTFPHTGFGYIEASDIDNGMGQVVRFREKPNYDTAVRFIQGGHFFWNAGIFIWKAQTIIDLIYRHIPADADHYRQLVAGPKTQGNDPWFVDVFGQLQNISIDFAVMEHAASVTRLMPAEIGWDDIGNWSSMDQHWPRDSDGNAVRGDIVTVNSANNIVYSKSKTVALVDVHNLIVVETDDAILVLPKSSDQRIRELVEKLPSALK
ncbi:mannose-1-phosphate guanylyltransferase [bacterium]|nr:mannose-1-phosphate guanylyltransferase [bacterium]